MSREKPEEDHQEFETLEELCLSKCDCGYILPRPEWAHSEDCAYTKAVQDNNATKNNQ